ncbi:hypothetical protein DBR37_01900 [Herminiimonas sp. KBW02]|uniref:hypothetical protein n=1 Tax=Herminiimonas sp. KBW02 TaxID=2153363 RepID=UPI000F59B086|nr:hypothetical protein [Herminiimonas sp. KBW02]RQO36975.1 hypothetical protein DBR37_01900 [Herminiimonas sp. KBW02]
MRFSFSGAAILLAAFILMGCNTIPQARIAEAPDARSQEEKCYQDLAALKQLEPETYEKYRQQMHAIDENYRVYKANESLLDENASEVMLTEVRKKLSLVCTRINNAVYTNMRGRAQSLNKL